MRIRTSLALGLLLVLTAAGCGKAGGTGDEGVASAGGGKADATPTATATGGTGVRRDPQADQEAFLKFAQCMRDHGVPMEDPNFEGNGVSLTIPEGTDKSKVDAAQAECKSLMPNGGEPPKLSPEQQERMRKYAQCMRDQGITNFPDPSEEGGFMIDGDKLSVDLRGEQMKAAEKACEQYDLRPKGGDGEAGEKTTQDSGGGA
ncbi:hypothetical protein ACQP00_47070 [Dactylosporangium sp. CS-047395]|uniref:hypothetical protein n=1 Tax=Dactylosporangium sp. CS-047395 TaxID=3239936 RepID=UPI003D91C7E3